MTDQQILIVDAAHIDPARAQFPGLMVLANRAEGDEFTNLDLKAMAGRDVILWCHYATMLAEGIAPKAARVRIVNGDKSPMSFASRPRESRQYILTNLRAYTPAAELDISHPMAEPPAEPVTAPVQSVASEPVRPTATVTPITEARTVRQAKLEPEAGTPPSKYSQDALALEFTAINPDWRYVPAWGKWLRWSGTYWENDAVGFVMESARQICRGIAVEDRLNASASTIKELLKSSTISAVEKIARSDPAHARGVEQWDGDPWVLNTPGGIVDLRDGSIRPGRPNDHATKITRATPVSGAMCPVWMQFLADATNQNAELMRYLQRVCGYFLTGSVRDHALFFLHGQGGNGKGTFLRMINWVLNDYAWTADADVFIEQKNPQHKTELASFMSRRLVSSEEINEGARWNEARINKLTGGDTITANFMHRDQFSFMPTHKLLIVANNKPLFRNVGDAIRRRLHLIPFNHKIEKPDGRIEDTMRAEADGILRWAIAGCIEWQRDGLQPPECVLAATEGYLSSQDTLATWVSECCDVSPEWRAGTGALYKSFQRWADDNGEGALGRKRFVEAMATRGHESEKSGGTYWIKGLRVRVDTSAHNARFPDSD